MVVSWQAKNATRHNPQTGSLNQKKTGADNSMGLLPSVQIDNETFKIMPPSPFKLMDCIWFLKMLRVAFFEQKYRWILFSVPMGRKYPIYVSIGGRERKSPNTFPSSVFILYLKTEVSTTVQFSCRGLVIFKSCLITLCFQYCIASIRDGCLSCSFKTKDSYKPGILSTCIA